jgi:uncharacterized protein YndB with AHSA1/START domain
MNAVQEPQNSPEREIVITRLIDAPIERVWRAWADPSEIVQWWGPHGFKTDTNRREFKPGGTWKHTMIGPDGTRYPNAARYEEIVEHERIVYTNGGGREGGDKGVHFRAVVTFVALGNKTEITLRSVFDTPAEREFVAREYRAVEGGEQTLGRLATLVEGGFLISRLVDAPREKVWKCWTEPERLAAWFGPKGFETLAARLDFRPGGDYHYGIRGNGVEMWGKWTFREIDAPGRLVFLSAFSDKDGGLGRHPLAPTWPAQMMTTVLFADFGARTLITIQWSPYAAGEAERRTFAEGMASMNQGWSGTFERLDAYLKEAPDLVLTRLIDAPRERVWKAWTEPAQFAQWWGPRMFTCPACEIDVRPGGRIKLQMQGPEGSPYSAPMPMGGEFLEVVAPERIVFTALAFPDGNGGWKLDNHNTVVLRDRNGKTELTLSVIVRKFSPEIAQALAGMQDGWSQSLDKLAAITASGGDRHG